MIDSSKWEVIEAGLKCIQGKASSTRSAMKKASEQFKQQGAPVQRYGRRRGVMAFDEKNRARPIPAPQQAQRDLQTLYDIFGQ